MLQRAIVGLRHTNVRRFYVATPLSLLFVSHCPSENTRILRDAALAGIDGLNLDGIKSIVRDSQSAEPADVKRCAGVLVGTTENFGAMAGLTKDFFERIYYPCLEHHPGLPVALYIRAGEDGRGARQGIERILSGLRWELVAPPLILRGAYQSEFPRQVAELAMTLAAGLDAGVF